MRFRRDRPGRYMPRDVCRRPASPRRPGRPPGAPQVRLGGCLWGPLGVGVVYGGRRTPPPRPTPTTRTGRQPGVLPGPRRPGGRAAGLEPPSNALVFGLTVAGTAVLAKLNAITSPPRTPTDGRCSGRPPPARWRSLGPSSRLTCIISSSAPRPRATSATSCWPCRTHPGAARAGGGGCMGPPGQAVTPIGRERSGRLSRRGGRLR